MLAKLTAKYGRRIVVWAVVAVTSALARKAIERWAAHDQPTEVRGAPGG